MRRPPVGSTLPSALQGRQGRRRADITKGAQPTSVSEVTKPFRPRGGTPLRGRDLEGVDSVSRSDIRGGAERITSPVLVGRGRELAVLERAYERSLDGTPGAIVIGGEAGVGKSRLVAEFCAEAAARGARVVTGRCLPATEGVVPFAPVVDAVRAIVEAADLHVDFDTSGCLLPTAVRALGDAILGATSGSGSLSTAYAPVFELVVSFLRRLIALESVVL